MVNKPTTDMSLTGNGLRDWLAQRFSSLIIAIYFLVLLGFFIEHPQLDYTKLQPIIVRIMAQSLVILALTIYLCWGIEILWKIA